MGEGFCCTAAGNAKDWNQSCHTRPFCRRHLSFEQDLFLYIYFYCEQYQQKAVSCMRVVVEFVFVVCRGFEVLNYIFAVV